MVMVGIRDIGTRLEKFKPVGKRPYVRSVLILKTCASPWVMKV